MYVSFRKSGEMGNLLSVNNSKQIKPMKHKKLISGFFILMGLGVTGVMAQEFLNAAGGNASGSGGTSSFSVGQLIYTSDTGSNGSVAKGIQQPFEITVAAGIKEASGISLTWSAFPNPTRNDLTLQIEGEIKVPYLVCLYDLKGKLLLTKEITETLSIIEMGNLVPATYILIVSDRSKEIKSFQIIKN